MNGGGKRHPWIRLLVILAVAQASAGWTLVPHREGKGRTRENSLKVAFDIDAGVSTSPWYGRRNSTALSASMEELATILEGNGRAHSCWDCYRLGVDPLFYFGTSSGEEREPSQLSWGWTKDQIKSAIPLRRRDQVFGRKARSLLSKHFVPVEKKVDLSDITICKDGTIKLLLRLVDGLEVETVIIPWDDREASTLCISSQVGCAQACTFCATGRMGRLRSLTSCEILGQVYWAQKICRQRDVYPIENIVFMGLGEPADNVDAVVQASRVLVNRNQFEMAPKRVTISTVAPSPSSFEELGQADVVLAWSVHASRDELRKQLVPTTKYPMVELRQGLINALQERSRRMRQTMLEVALLDGINDSPEDAAHLAEFCQPIIDEVKGVKLIVNIIPWNDIGASSGPASRYQKPSTERVLAFQKVLVDRGLLCYVRTTRGDDESAACGMLSTKKRP